MVGSRGIQGWAGRRARARGVIAALAVLGVCAVSPTAPCAEPDSESHRFELRAFAVGHIGVTRGRVGPGIGGGLCGYFGDVFGLGIEAQYARVFPLGDPHESGSQRLDVEFVLRWRLASGRWVLHGGMGASIYWGQVDIPFVERCFGCGKYSGEGGGPRMSFGFAWVEPLAPNLLLEVGAVLATVFPVTEATDTHNFVPDFLSLGVRVALVGAF